MGNGIYYPVIDMKATGKKIKALIKSKRIKVEQVAEFMDFSSVQSIYKWQRGESLPTMENMFALSRLLGVGVDDIIVEMSLEGEIEPSSFFVHGHKNAWKFVA